MDGKEGKEEKEGREVQQAAGVRFAAALPQLMSVAGDKSCLHFADIYMYFMHLCKF